MDSMNQLNTAKRVQIVAALTEGMSIRATVRMTGAAKNTVVKLLNDLGCACAKYHDEHVRNLNSERVQCDEIWSFCYAKEKNLPDRMRDMPGVGSVWTWTAIDSDSKLMISYLCGNRDTETAESFMHDVAERVTNRIQLTTDGLKCYFVAVPAAFGYDIDYAIVNKVYGRDIDFATESRYSPPKCVGCVREGKIGRPLAQHVSTSHVERQNLTMRMGMRRFTRLTNGFSKKFSNLRHAVALHFMHYNYCRKHQTLGTSPAVKAGLADHVWSLDELIGLLDSN